MIIYDSYHSMIRAEKRANMGRTGAQKMIDRARENGKTPDQLSSDERNYLRSKESDGCRAVFNEGYCFIFSEEGICITLFRVPKWFGSKSRFDGKVRVRNPKKYYRNYSFEEYGIPA